MAVGSISDGPFTGWPSPSDWLQPDWPSVPGVKAVCTRRAGGVSAGVYSSFNLGDHVGDAPQAVAANRAALARAMGVRPVFLNQVHGTAVVPLTHGLADGLQADASVTRERGLACTVMVADCLPVLITSAQGGVVAAAHAGWRGLLQGVLEATLQQFWNQVEILRGSDCANELPAQTLVWLGPCIGPQRFEVGAEVREAFALQRPDSVKFFQPLGREKYLADLPGLARQRLAAWGVQPVFGNDGSAQWCTASQPARFFSHRRDGVSGRMAACVWMD